MITHDLKSHLSPTTSKYVLNVFAKIYRFYITLSNFFCFSFFFFFFFFQKYKTNFKFRNIFIRNKTIY